MPDISFQRRTTDKPRRQYVAHGTAALGGLIILVELTRYWFQGHQMEGAVIGIGALFGFVGSYMANSRKALEAGGFVVSSFLDGVAVLRTGKRAGRRSTDTVVVDSPVAEQSEAPRGE